MPKNDPDQDYGRHKFMFLINLNNQGLLYERKIYSILSLLGNIGEVSEALNIIVTIILYTIKNSYNET